MTDQVKYQLERAVDALRSAVELGAATEDAYLLRNIVETITKIEGWNTSYRYNLTKEPQKDNSFKFTLSTPDYFGGMNEYPISYYNTAGNDVITFS